MAIKFEYRGVIFTADTAQEAAEMMAILEKKEAEAVIGQMQSRVQSYMQTYERAFGALREENFVWTPDYFDALINRIGETQKLALALLVTKKSLADEELRSALKVSGNQALAGVLSGISKQAIALNIPARAIFDFENIRVGGKRRSDYIVSREFQDIAARMSWPPSSLLCKADL
jgi:hypothetical protein